MEIIVGKLKQTNNNGSNNHYHDNGYNGCNNGNKNLKKLSI